MVFSVYESFLVLWRWWYILLIGHASCVQDQAAGDGVDVCTEDMIDGFQMA